jgi:hypothetical protein
VCLCVCVCVCVCVWPKSRTDSQTCSLYGVRERERVCVDKYIEISRQRVRVLKRALYSDFR